MSGLRQIVFSWLPPSQNSRTGGWFHHQLLGGNWRVLWCSSTLGIFSWKGIRKTVIATFLHILLWWKVEPNSTKTISSGKTQNYISGNMRTAFNNLMFKYSLCLHWLWTNSLFTDDRPEVHLTHIRQMRRTRRSMALYICRRFIVSPATSNLLLGQVAAFRAMYNVSNMNIAFNRRHVLRGTWTTCTAIFRFSLSAINYNYAALVMAPFRMKNFLPIMPILWHHFSCHAGSRSLPLSRRCGSAGKRQYLEPDLASAE